MKTLPEKIQKILNDKERLQWFAAKYANARDVFFVMLRVCPVILELKKRLISLSERLSQTLTLSWFFSLQVWFSQLRVSFSPPCI